MHYKKKRNTKIHSGSFYLSQKFLEILDLIAQIEGQSRSVIIERVVLYKSGGSDAKSWDKSKRAYKKKKKIFATQRNAKKNKNRSKESADFKNALFEFMS